MDRYKHVAIIMCLVLFAGVLSGQKGAPYITNFKVQKPFDYNNFDIAQDDRGMMLFANGKGILVFDGVEWTLTRTPDFPYVLHPSGNRTIIYTGCYHDFGYVKRNNKGLYSYTSISESFYKPGLVFFIDSLEGNIVFIDEHSIVKVISGNKSIKNIIPAGNGESFVGAFIINKTLYVYTNRMTLYKVNDNKLVQVASELFQNVAGSVKFTRVIDEKTCLIGNTNNKLFLFNGKTIRPFIVKDQSYLDLSGITNARSVSDSVVAISTLTGGCVVINKKNGQTSAMLNYANGLPDDEIIAIGIDKEQGLWLWQAMGISRVDCALPLRVVSHYQGLQGNLLSVLFVNNTLYVTTSEGVFMGGIIQEQKPISVKKQKAKVKTIPKQQELQKISETQPQIQKEETKKPTTKKRGFFKDFFKIESTKKSESEPSSPPPPPQSASDQAMNKILQGSRTAEVDDKKKEMLAALQKQTYVFTKVEGIEQDKCKQIIRFNDHVLVSSNRGIYDIQQKKAVNILQGAYVNFIMPSLYNPGNLFVCTSEGILIMTVENGKWQSRQIAPDSLRTDIFSVYEMNKQEILAGGYGKAYRIILKDGTNDEVKQIKLTQDFPDKVIIRNIQGTYYFLSSTAMLRYDAKQNMAVTNDTLQKIRPTFIYSHGFVTWIKISGKWSMYAGNQERDHVALSYLNMFENIEDIFIDYNNRVWIIDNLNNLYYMSSQVGKTYMPQFSLFVKGIRDRDGAFLPLENLAINYSENALQLQIRAPFYIDPGKIQYQFFIEEKMDDWSVWSNDPVIDFPFLSPGKYIIHFKARNVLGEECTKKTVEFFVKPPFWQTWWFYSLSVLAFIGLVIVVMWQREKKLKRDKRILEEKVVERTKTIEAQKTEIIGQRDLIAKQNEDIRNSIKYAKRIQTAVMPTEEKLHEILPEYFIFYRPRDIVSGDFYWMTQRNNKLVVVAADCTGHGVSGAFMSMLGVAFLNEIVHRASLESANEILNDLRRYVKSTLSQTGKKDEAKDGMDLVLCIFDFNIMKLNFAGAYNPLIQIRNNELIEHSGDSMPIGIHLVEKDSFTNHVIDLQKGDVFYMFSDGYQDQLGGENRQKFMSKTFKNLLLNIHARSMQEQHDALAATFDQWKGERKQTDDVMIIGMRI